MVFILAPCIAFNCLRRAANQRRDADETQRQVTAKSQRIAEEQKECKKLEELARADLATVEPALNEAMKVVTESPNSFPTSLIQFRTISLIVFCFNIFLIAYFIYFCKFLLINLNNFIFVISLTK